MIDLDPRVAAFRRSVGNRMLVLALVVGVACIVIGFVTSSACFMVPVGLAALGFVGVVWTLMQQHARDLSHLVRMVDPREMLVTLERRRVDEEHRWYAWLDLPTAATPTATPLMVLPVDVAGVPQREYAAQPQASRQFWWTRRALVYARPTAGNIVIIAGDTTIAHLGHTLPPPEFFALPPVSPWSRDDL